MGWKGGFGRVAGEDFDVACEAGVGVEGREDGGTDVARGLKRVLGIVDGGGEVALFTPITMIFLRIEAITEA